MIIFNIVVSFVIGAVCLLRGHRRSGVYLLVHGVLSTLNYVAGSFYVGLLAVLILPALLLHLGAHALGRPILARTSWLAVPAFLVLGWAMDAFHDAGAFWKLTEASWLTLGVAALVSFLLASRPLVRDEQLLLLFTIGGLGEIGFLMARLPYSYITLENLCLYLVTLIACAKGRGDRPPRGPQVGGAVGGA